VKETNFGDIFQQNTKYTRNHLPGGRLDWANKPDALKAYPAAPRFALSNPKTTDGPAIWEVLNQRRSVRRFADAPLREQELSQLLWATQGVTQVAHSVLFRTAPSAGALYPIETYVVVHSVETIDPGIYHYAVGDHELEQIRRGDFRADIARAALDQGFAHSAGLVLVWTAILPRSKWKYKQRAYRYVYLDAGHIAQNAALAAVSLGLGSCQIGALYDNEANALLEVDGMEETTVYMTAVGRPEEFGQTCVSARTVAASNS